MAVIIERAASSKFFFLFKRKEEAFIEYKLSAEAVSEGEIESGDTKSLVFLLTLVHCDQNRLVSLVFGKSDGPQQFS